MSIKDFHIIFIIISSILMIYVSYWSYMKWSYYLETTYLLYMFISIIAFVILIFYSKKFKNKFRELSS